ncbi:bifunctional diaminohydroxyphosphoribosylaminopyrimidine deaminase/5-amino-6-(5-phosphoribosylamino)uracil reductase RibD [Lactiplantibacillus herbarum]|uniref:bifunctional diaminohydroxyphosphoribosylaminopyrimidine deaminase/5-amino-6-(5-phosphoribosylamino)uracil reductase RibD n=1 Tax=Lactiplantibacillus herbarum TaxID=1670446 RepID=UPI000A5C39DC|nr:deaminase [Lactiplantibacillus herbarum]
MLTDYMQQAIYQARLGGPATYRNPQVGAVVVKDGRVIAQGYHHYFGGAHAEVDALAHLTSDQTRGATLIVTLEPCSHHGKTPPCCERVTSSWNQ